MGYRILIRFATHVGLPLLYLALSAPAFAQPLQDAVQTALRRNPEVLGAAANLRAANEAYAAASAGLFPVVDLRVGSGREETDSLATRAATGGGSRTLNRQEANLTLRQNIYDGQQVRSEMDSQKFRVESTHSRLAETAEQIAFRVTEIYLDALRDAEIVRLATDNVRNHEQLLEKTRWRFSSGVGQRADVEQASARLALANAQLEASRGNAEDTMARYQRVVGRLPQGLVMPASPERQIPATLAEAQQLGRDNSYGLRAAQADANSAQATIRTVRSELFPRFDVELAANRNRDTDGIPTQNNDLSAMLVMRYNLYRGGGDQARVRQARERETAAAENTRNITEFTDESVARSWAARATARNRLAPLENHVLASEQVLEAYRSQFELGRRSLLDLVNAENELFQSRATLSSGRITMRSSEFRLLASMGLLVKSLGLSDELLKLAAPDGATGREAGDNAAAHDKR